MWKPGLKKNRPGGEEVPTSFVHGHKGEQRPRLLQAYRTRHLCGEGAGARRDVTTLCMHAECTVRRVAGDCGCVSCDHGEPEGCGPDVRLGVCGSMVDKMAAESRRKIWLR